MGAAARKVKLALPADLSIDEELDLNLAGDAHFLRACLKVSLLGVDRETAQVLVKAADQTCPYSEATRAITGIAAGKLGLLRSANAQVVSANSAQTPPSADRRWLHNEGYAEAGTATTRMKIHALVRDRTILMSTLSGEQHSLGVNMVEKFPPHGAASPSSYATTWKQGC